MEIILLIIVKMVTLSFQRFKNPSTIIVDKNFTDC